MLQSLLFLLFLLLLILLSTIPNSYSLISNSNSNSKSNGKIFVQGGDEFNTLCKSFDKRFIDECGGSKNARIGNQY